MNIEYIPLSPIRFLFKEIISVFRINNNDFMDAVKHICDNYQKEQISIKIVSKQFIGLRDLVAQCNLDSLEIMINECLLCALWCSSYFMADVYISLIDYLSNKKQVLSISEKSMELLLYAKSLVPSFDAWPDELPKPQNFDNDKLAYLSNLIMPIAFDVVLCHEIAHLSLEHIKGGKIQQEYEADELAVKWILDKQIEEYPLKELAAFAAFTTMTIIDLNAKKVRKTHPSSLSRMYNYLEKLAIDENDILWGVAIIVYRAWEKAFNSSKLDLPDMESSLRKIFQELLKS